MSLDAISAVRLGDAVKVRARVCDNVCLYMCMRACALVCLCEHVKMYNNVRL